MGPAPTDDARADGHAPAPEEHGLGAQLHAFGGRRRPTRDDGAPGVPGKALEDGGSSAVADRCTPAQLHPWALPVPPIPIARHPARLEELGRAGAMGGRAKGNGGRTPTGRQAVRLELAPRGPVSAWAQ
jgi:hypothetical protein